MFQVITHFNSLKVYFLNNLFQVVVKTVSGSVASWPATGNVTTRPLPVLENIQTIIDEDTKESAVVWEPHPDSYQDEYKVRKRKRNLIHSFKHKAKFGD
jgi:hypothetical protein